MGASKKLNPFTFGLTQKDGAFTNRSAELEQLYELYTNSINCILVSPRRWGKSSLVKESARVFQAKNKNMRFCFIDMFTVASEDEFYQKYASELLKISSTKLQETLAQAGQYFKKIVPKLSLGLSPENNISVSFDWKDLQQHKTDVLELSQRIAEKKGFQIVVCIDEFQSLSRFSNPQQFQRTLRSVWQNHDKVSYCLYGSKRNMMEHIFNNRKMPFYRFGEFIPLGKIALEHWLPFIQKGFSAANKKITDEQIEWIVGKMDKHPYYVQQLAYHVWNSTSTEVNQAVLNECLQRIIEQNSWMYEKEVENLSRTQLNLIKAIVSGEKQLSGKAALAQYNLGTSATVTKNKRIFEENDVIIKQKGQIIMVDPVFVLWMKQRFELG